MPFIAGKLATLNNAGTLDLSSGNNRTNDTLTVQGSYAGNGGQMLLQSLVGDDSSPSDKLVVINGSITGSTLITVSNLGGTGGLTQQNGIQLVQAHGTAVSNADAFALKTSVSAGAFDYRLFKGGVTPGTENSWYLRSAVVAPATIAAYPTPIRHCRNSSFRLSQRPCPPKHRRAVLHYRFYQPLYRVRHQSRFIARKFPSGRYCRPPPHN